MKITQFYPLLQVADVAATQAFFQTHFDFEPAFESDWYVHLQSKHSPTTNVTLLDANHDTIPEQARGLTQRVILSFEVEDVDTVYAACSRRGMTIVQPLKDEPHGQRHFIGVDPNGILIDVITPIAPSEEFLSQYRADAVPS